MVVRFRGVVATSFSPWPSCTPQQITAYDRLLVSTDSEWLSLRAHRGNKTRHFRVFFDEVGCYELLASDFALEGLPDDANR